MNLLSEEKQEMIKALEEAYKIYKVSELYLKDVNDDYGKQKIARLRYDFAKHRLLEVWHEASKNGVLLENCAFMKNFFNIETSKV